MSKITLTSMDAILDGTIDDLADKPSFKPFAPGLAKAVISTEVVKVEEKKKEGIKFKFVMVESLELANAADEAPKAGDLSETLFFLIHPNEKTVELGQGQFKEHMKVVAGQFGAKPTGQLLQDLDGSEVYIVTDVDVRDGKEYLKLEMLSFSDPR